MSTTKRPNIVFVVADDTTPSHHGCYGGPTPTPHIDAIAQRGVRFARGYCNASLCCPSRWTMFTGQVTQRSPTCYRAAAADEPALIQQNGMLEQDTPTLARALRADGYFTGHIGKWHSRFGVEELGLEEPTKVSGDPDDPAVDAEIRKRHANAVQVIKAYAGFEYADRVQWGNIGGKHNAGGALAHNIAWMTDGALDFLDVAAADDRPFYLHLANSVPHAPNCQDSLNVDHRYTLAGKLDEPPRSHPADDTVLERMRAAGLDTAGGLAGVNAGQIMIDDQIGELLTRLEAIGELENTIFVYTADHGVPGKGSCLPTGQHLPAVMQWPAGLAAGRVVHDLFSWADYVPTLAEACGVRMPSEHTLDGFSVLPALRGESAWPRRYHYHEMGWVRALTDGRHWLIQNRMPASHIARLKAGEEKATYGTGVGFDNLNGPFVPDFLAADQLYDIEHDIYCQVNLIDDATRAAKREELTSEMQRICSTMPRPFPAEADAWTATPEAAAMRQQRRTQLEAIEHSPSGFAPRYWFQNLQDPDLQAT